jgi:2-polyprenyl-3-methyl-5-hydroxy-6-metoxy-1,4-benzoquinol methylase
VVAADVEPEMVRHVHHTAMTRGIANITTQVLDGTVPDLPENADVIFVCDVLHHVADRPRWLARLASRMGPKTRLALLEFKEGDLPEGPPAAAKIPRAELMRLTQGAGLVLAKDHGDLLPYQVFLEFKKP